MLRVLLLVSSLLLVSFPIQAQHIYSWRDADGIMNYSDSPPVGGETGYVRKLRTRTFTESADSSYKPRLTKVHEEETKKVTSTESRRGQNGTWSPYGGGNLSLGGNSGGLKGGGSSGGGGSVASGSGTDSGGGTIATSSDSSTSSGTTTTSSSGTTTSGSDSSTTGGTTTASSDTTTTGSTTTAASGSSSDSTSTTSSGTTTASSGGSTSTSGSTTSSGSTSTSSGGSTTTTASPTDPSTSGTTGQITLYWDPVGVAAGYRLYYGTSASTYPQAYGNGVNVGNVSSYTVTRLQSGQRYYFSATAFDTMGNESILSNQVFADIP